MPNNKIKFWILLILLNCFLFLPKYLIEYNSSTFFPHANFLHFSLYDSFKFLFVRYNYDIFRINVDLFLLVFIFYFLRKRINLKKYAWYAGIYYVVMFLFIVYYNVLEKVFLIKPVLYDDLYLFKLGFINSGGRLSLLLVAEILFFFVIVWLSVKLFQYFFTLVLDIQFGKKSKIVLGIIGLLLMINIFKSGLTFEPHHTFQSTFLMMADNVQYSVEAFHNLKQFDIKKLNRQMNYDQYQLKKKPNVYFLFVESYGKILYENQNLRPKYLELMESCQNKLQANGFHVFSQFSTSPVSGGGSWISYSSVMFGFNLKNQATYLSLMKIAETADYNHQFRWFNKQGYRNYRLISMPDNENLKVPWELYSRFYGADEWIRFKDLDYHGIQYGFGPSPPDQYSISYANDYIQKKGITPYTLFFISQNSHSPFYCPDSVVTNWRSLNNTKQMSKSTSAFLKNPNFNDYSKAITYDLASFVQFITTEGKDNDIFILIGDHQPPMLTDEDAGFETPVHIIVRDSMFGSGFSKYGFTPGMLITGNHKAIKHEGVYSMFMHEFIKNYGTDTTHLPVYRPEGIQKEYHE